MGTAKGWLHLFSISSSRPYSFTKGNALVIRSTGKLLPTQQLEAHLLVYSHATDESSRKLPSKESEQQVHSVLSIYCYVS